MDKVKLAKGQLLIIGIGYEVLNSISLLVIKDFNLEEEKDNFLRTRISDTEKSAIKPTDLINYLELEGYVEKVLTTVLEPLIPRSLSNPILLCVAREEGENVICDVTTKPVGWDTPPPNNPYKEN